MGYSKRPFALDTLPPEEHWGLHVGQLNGAPLSIRLNESALRYVGHPEMPVRATISLPLHTANEHGIPSEDEQAQLAYIDSVVFESVTGARIGRVVSVLSTLDEYEITAYVRSKQDADELQAQLASMITTHKTHVSSADDPEWTWFANLLPQRSIAETDLLTGKAAQIAYGVVGWMFIGLATIALVLVVGGLVPMVLDGGLGEGASDLALGAMIVCLPLVGVGILAYVGVRFLQQGKSPA